MIDHNDTHAMSLYEAEAFASFEASYRADSPVGDRQECKHQYTERSYGVKCIKCGAIVTNAGEEIKPL